MVKYTHDRLFFHFLVGGGEKCRSRNNPSGLPEKKMYPDFGVGIMERG
jgi:hypothetical protein